MPPACVVPVSRSPFCYANAEDGIVLADEELRDELSVRYPAAWRRITQRRQFMREALGIKIDESVLPLSNIPGWFAPYAKNLGRAFVNR